MRSPEWGEHVFEQLAREVQSTTTPSAREPKRGDTPTARVERVLSNCKPPPRGHDCWTPELLRGHLGAHIEASTGDRTLAWLITLREKAAGQTRLYYTQHKLGRLAECWVIGIRSAGLAALLGADANGKCASQKRLPHAHVPSSERPEPEQRSVAPTNQAPADPPPLAGWPWNDEDHMQPVVGAAFTATPADVKRLIQVFREKLSAPVDLDSRSSIREHHRHLLLFTLVLQGLCTALRAVRSPTTVIRALEQFDRIRERAGLPPSDDDIFAGLADKETYYNQRARLVSVPAVLVRQLRILQQHQRMLVVRLDRVTQWQAAPARVRAMFCLGEKDNPAEVTVSWFKKQLADLGFPWPGNFWRAFVRTQMLERGCPAADLDALLGHRDKSGGAIALHSTHDFRASSSRLQTTFKEIHAELKLRTVRSALLPEGDLARDREIILAPMHDAGPMGRGRSLRVRHQRQQRNLPLFWQSIHQGATDDDRRQVPILFRLLRNWARGGNVFAGLLCSPDPVHTARERMRSPGLLATSVGIG